MGRKWDDSANGPDESKDPASRLFRERRPRARKDRKKWCRGKVGVEHRRAIVIPKNSYRGICRYYPLSRGNFRWICAHIEICTECGKHLDILPPCPTRAELGET